MQRNQIHFQIEDYSARTNYASYLSLRTLSVTLEWQFINLIVCVLKNTLFNKGPCCLRSRDLEHSAYKGPCCLRSRFGTLCLQRPMLPSVEGFGTLFTKAHAAFGRGIWNTLFTKVHAAFGRGILNTLFTKVHAAFGREIWNTKSDGNSDFNVFSIFPVNWK